MESEMFFGHRIDLLSLGGKGMVLLMAALFGGLIGLERRFHGNAAGLRTISWSASARP